MRFAIASAALATLATTASAANFQVQVGGAGLQFQPNTVTAAMGDTVSFVFMPKNHTVTQSSFAAPCQFLAGGIDSGFQPVAANAAQVPSFTVTVNSTAPLWFYCKQTGHCETGMVFAINPTANKTFAAFQATAKASSANGAPPASGSSAASPSGSTAPSGSTTPSSASAAPSSSSSSSSNGAIAAGARAGGLLALVGLAAGVLL